MKAAIITDSTASLTPEETKAENLFVIPLSFLFSDGEIQFDSNDPHFIESFYTRLKNEKEQPKTSQPSPDRYLKVLEEIISKGYDTVFAIHMSSKLSGTFQLATLLSHDVEDRLKMYVLDSKSISIPMGSQVRVALEMVEKNYNAEAILEKLTYMADETNIFISIPDIKNLVKGGRLNAGVGLIASALKIVPILAIQNGEVTILEKVRTEKKSIARLKEHLLEQAKKYNQKFEVIVADSMASTRDTFISQLHDLFPDQPLRSGYLTPVIGVYGGIGVLGCALVPTFDLTPQD